MKRTIERYQRYRTLEKILEGHTEAFENRPEILEMKASFSAALTLIANLISKLRQPVFDIYQHRIDVRLKFKETLQSMIAIMLHFAVKIDDKPLIKLLMGYRSKTQLAAAYNLYNIGVNVLQLLTQYQEQMEGLGFTAAEVSAFTAELEAYNQSIQDAGFQLNSRKNSRADLNLAMSQCDTLVKGRIDTFVAHMAAKYPALNQEYRLARFRKRKKSKPGEDINGTADISGTVYDGATGKPVENVTINLIELDHVAETDEDGVFLFDELPAGNYTLSYHGNGYQVPEAVQVNIGDGESLVYDLTLVPLEKGNTAA
ncbi:MAG: carboxypeptidase-like regulatory domain-containing protein [Lentimicrobium sp.]|jgi:hypothetical protein|nr:carboxypeptidase-like regulatory domain-containing protein [Lentimicrobium sp.]